MWDVIHVLKIKNKYDELAKLTNIPTKIDENMVNYYKNSDENQLLYLTEVLLEFYCRDEFISMFRKVEKACSCIL